MAKVTIMSLGVVPRTGTPNPVVFSSENLVFLVFECQPEDPDSTQPVSSAIVTIQECLVWKFGYPNDEALVGHPLYQDGLKYYEVQEIQDSPWSNELRAQNEVGFPNCNFPIRRHFVFTFHDSTFECIAEEMSVDLSNEPRRSVLSKLAAIVANDA